jgi:plasmid stability protein
MKTTFDLPDELVREMKLRAVMQGRTLRDLAADFIRQGLGLTAPRLLQAPSPGSRAEISADGMPIIRGEPDAHARLMSAETLIALEQALLTQEDMQRAGLPV